MTFAQLLAVVLLLLAVATLFLISAALLLTALVGLAAARRNPALPPHFRRYRQRQLLYGGGGVLLFGGLLLAGYLRSGELRAAFLCQRRLQRLATTLSLYLSVNGRLPEAGQWCDALQALRPGLDFHCPRDRGGGPDASSYALNRHLAGADRETVERAASVVLLFESGAHRWNAADGGESWPDPGRHCAGPREAGSCWNHLVVGDFSLGRASGARAEGVRWTIEETDEGP